MNYKTLRLPQISALLVLFLLSGSANLAVAQQSPPDWKVASPYPDNPLKQATLSGKATHGPLSDKAEMQLECRPDADGPRLNLISVPAQLKFDADPFEGPGGLGERVKLRLTLGNATWSHGFSGYYVDGKAFAFSFALSDAEARGMANRLAPSVTVAVEPAKKGTPLVFHFDLPPASAAVSSMIAPCLNRR